MVFPNLVKAPAFNLTQLLRSQQSWLCGAKLAFSQIALLLFIASLVVCYDASSPEAHIGERESDIASADASSIQTPSKPQTSESSTSLQTSGADLMVHEREFVSPQVRVQIECQRDKTVIKVNFSQPFNGILSAGKLDTSQCKLNGNGTKLYEIQVKHNSSRCDTQWDSANSSIFNTLFIRFHPTLETGSDLAKNVMCRLTVGDLVVGRRPLKTSSKVSLIPSASPSQSTELLGGDKKVESLIPDSKIESLS